MLRVFDVIQITKEKENQKMKFVLLVKKSIASKQHHSKAKEKEKELKRASSGSSGKENSESKNLIS